MENQSCSLKTLGTFMWRIPQRLSSSAALAGVTSCLLASHDAVVRGNRRSRINAHLYARALRRLQRAIEDPEERLSSNTLCTVLLFQRIEAVFGECFAPIHQSSLQNWRKHGELVHASGLAALVQEKGPPKPEDKSDVFVIIDSHACIIHQALVQGKVCFLASKEWEAALDSIEGRTDIQIIFYQILRQMTLWPALLDKKKLTLCDGDLATNLSSLLNAAQRVQAAMYDIGHDLDTLIETRRVCRKTPSTCLSDLVSEIIIVLRIIWSVTDVLHRIVLEFDILHLCKRSALMMTMESVDLEAQESIVEITNELDRFHEPGRITWTREALIKKAMVYRGDFSIYHN
ncbi:hypothetical protein N7510_004250 [Penicillium lagena]|uniref:uncharacterized protein n=1 Tax=Penicillium lagena TaxID=94218 RepID=UPI0025401767|nr:uncharacterized protein N7510_004250 [Penicillium lagena]KAJ5620266.1 hypothetical protein N7510_004250 [Penicillium lagena]